MRAIEKGLLFLFISSSLCATERLRSADFFSTQQAAESFIDLHEFNFALEMYQRLLKENPTDINTLERFSQLALLLQGRSSTQDILQKFLTQEKSLARKEWDRVEKIFRITHSTFVTDRGQTLYYQGLLKVEREDYPGAIELFRQANALEEGHLLILRAQLESEKKLPNLSATIDTMTRMLELNPIALKTAEELSALYLEQENPTKAAEVLASAKKLRGQSVIANEAKQPK